MLDNFKGQIITETYDQPIISDLEISQILALQSVEEVSNLRNGWLNRFVGKGGF